MPRPRPRWICWSDRRNRGRAELEVLNAQLWRFSCLDFTRATGRKVYDPEGIKVIIPAEPYTSFRFRASDTCSSCGAPLAHHLHPTPLSAQNSCELGLQQKVRFESPEAWSFFDKLASLCLDKSEVLSQHGNMQQFKKNADIYLPVWCSRQNVNTWRCLLMAVQHTQDRTSL